MNSAHGAETLYVSDLDGTLLGSDGSLSRASARLLNQALAAGALFTYATARSFRSSRRVTEALQLSLPVITYGGTITADPQTGSPQDLQLLDEAVVDAVVQAGGVVPEAEPVWHTFEDGRDWLRWRPDRMTAGVTAFIDHRAGDPRLRPITADDPLDQRRVFYVAVLAPRRSLLTLRDELAAPLRSTAHFLSEDPATPSLDWLEFHSPEGTKARAVQRLMSQLGAGQLVVFGDNHNDVPMFEIADRSFAVANAVAELTTVATSVIGHHDSDAVARQIADECTTLTRKRRAATRLRVGP